MTNHKTKHIVYNNIEQDVDEKIADLILNLFKLDVAIINSCQNYNNQNYVLIEFLSPDDAKRFLNLVADFTDKPNSVYRAMFSDNIKDWKYDVSIEDFGVNPVFDNDGYVIKQEFSGEHDINIFFAIRFPQRHLAFVKKRIEKAVKELIEESSSCSCEDESDINVTINHINSPIKYNIN